VLIVIDRLEELDRRSRAGCKDDVKSVRSWPATSSSVIAGLSSPVNVPTAGRDLPLAELQRLYGPSFLPPVGGLGAMPPLPQSWYQSPELAAEFLQRERERIEQLGKWTRVKSTDIV